MEKLPSQRLDDMLRAIEGIEVTPAIDALIGEFATALDTQRTDALCDLFGRLRRGGYPPITPENPVFVECNYDRRNYMGATLEEAYEIHARWCRFHSNLDLIRRGG